MASRDLYDNLWSIGSIWPGLSRTTDEIGDPVDTIRRESVVALIQAGEIQDGTTTFILEDSDDASGWDPVDSSYIQGSLPALTSSDTNMMFRVGYIGPRRYVRMITSVAGATLGAFYSVTFALGNNRSAPAEAAS